MTSLESVGEASTKGIQPAPQIPEPELGSLKHSGARTARILSARLVWSGADSRCQRARQTSRERLIPAALRLRCGRRAAGGSAAQRNGTSGTGGTGPPPSGQRPSGPEPLRASTRHGLTPSEPNPLRTSPALLSHSSVGRQAPGQPHRTPLPSFHVLEFVTFMSSAYTSGNQQC